VRRANANCGPSRWRLAKGETSEQINNLVERALTWLKSHDYPNQILKWPTEAWGEIPADYGRK
jgi:ribonuclease HI